MNLVTHINNPKCPYGPHTLKDHGYRRGITEQEDLSGRGRRGNGDRAKDFICIYENVVICIYENIILLVCILNTHMEQNRTGLIVE